jgi:hypothetical protein
VTAKRLLRWVAGGLLTVVGLFAIAIGALWLMITEPWYDTALLAQMRPGVNNAAWRNDAVGIADFFPYGMTLEKAKALLRQNGFFCSPPRSSEDNIAHYDCLREKSDLVCQTKYVISLSVSAGAVTEVKPSSYAACL